MEVEKQTSQEPTEEDFVGLVASKYKLLRALYPDKKLTFTKLSKIIDKKTLSDSQEPLKNAGLIVIFKEKSKKTGKFNRFFKLTPDGQKIIGYIIRLRGRLAPQPFEYEENMQDALLLLKDNKTQDLAADQVQLISRETHVPANSMLFTYIKNNLSNIGSNHIKSVLLLSLQSILRYSDHESREIIAGNVVDVLQIIGKEQANERPGVIAQLIIKEFYLNDANYESVETEYLQAVKTNLKSMGSLREIIVDKFPDKKIELRGKLLNLLTKADYNLSLRIKEEFNKLY